MVEQKDLMMTLASVCATISGFSLVVVGIISATRTPSSTRKPIVALGFGAAATLVLGLFSTFAALQWLYAAAPESLMALRGIWFDASRIYQLAWLSFILTCLGIIYIAVVATLFVLPSRELTAGEHRAAKRQSHQEAK